MKRSKKYHCPSAIDIPEGKWPLFVDEAIARDVFEICRVANVDPIEFMEDLMSDLVRNAVCGLDDAKKGHFDGIMGRLLKGWEFTKAEEKEVKAGFTAIIEAEQGRALS